MGDSILGAGHSVEGSVKTERDTSVERRVFSLLKELNTGLIENIQFLNQQVDQASNETFKKYLLDWELLIVEGQVKTLMETTEALLNQGENIREVVVGLFPCLQEIHEVLFTKDLNNYLKQLEGAGEKKLIDLIQTQISSWKDKFKSLDSRLSRALNQLSTNANKTISASARWKQLTRSSNEYATEENLDASLDQTEEARYKQQQRNEAAKYQFENTLTAYKNISSQTDSMIPNPSLSLEYSSLSVDAFVTLFVSIAVYVAKSLKEKVDTISVQENDLEDIKISDISGILDAQIETLKSECKNIANDFKSLSNYIGILEDQLKAITLQILKTFDINNNKLLDEISQVFSRRQRVSREDEGINLITNVVKVMNIQERIIFGYYLLNQNRQNLALQAQLEEKKEPALALFSPEAQNHAVQHSRQSSVNSVDSVASSTKGSNFFHYLPNKNRFSNGTTMTEVDSNHGEVPDQGTHTKKPESS